MEAPLKIRHGREQDGKQQRLKRPINFRSYTYEMSTCSANSTELFNSLSTLHFSD